MTVKFTGRRAAHARRLLERLESLRALPPEPTCSVCAAEVADFVLVDTEEHGRCCAQCVATCECGERWPRVAMTSAGVCPHCRDEAAAREDEQGDLEVDCRQTVGGPRYGI